MKSERQRRLQQEQAQGQGRAEGVERGQVRSAVAWKGASGRRSLAGQAAPGPLASQREGGHEQPRWREAWREEKGSS